MHKVLTLTPPQNPPSDFYFYREQNTDFLSIDQWFENWLNTTLPKDYPGYELLTFSKGWELTEKNAKYNITITVVLKKGKNARRTSSR